MYLLLDISTAQVGLCHSVGHNLIHDINKLWKFSHKSWEIGLEPAISLLKGIAFGNVVCLLVYDAWSVWRTHVWSGGTARHLVICFWWTLVLVYDGKHAYCVLGVQCLYRAFYGVIEINIGSKLMLQIHIVQHYMCNVQLKLTALKFKE